MKAILIVFYLSIFLSPVFAQKIVPGKYCTTDHYSELCIEFFQDSTFDFYQVGAFDLPECGKGHFAISKDTLILYFNRYLNDDSAIVVEKQMCKDKDSINLDFFIYDFITMEPICFVILEAWKRVDSVEKVMLKGTYTDLNGKASFKLPNSTQNTWMEVKYIAYKRDSLALSPIQCQKISIGLIASCRVVNSGKIKKYKIKRSNEKQLILLNLETGYSELLKCKR